MNVKPRRINVLKNNSRLNYLKQKSPNNEIGVLVIKERINPSKNFEQKKSSIINQKKHNKFVANLLTAIE